MKKIEAPHVFAAILSLAAIGIIIIFVAPDAIGEIVGAVIAAIGMLGMKLLENGTPAP